MAAVSKRVWKTARGEVRTAWVCTYVDTNGHQHRKQFKLKRDADSERVRVEGELAAGVHVPDGRSITVDDAARAFLADFEELVEAGKRERSTSASYEQHVRLHIAPFDIAGLKLSRLTGPDCVQFAADLEKFRTEDTAEKVLVTFKSIIKFARTRGWIVTNPAEAVSIRTSGDRARDGTVAVPSKPELKSLLEATQTFDRSGRAEAFVSLLLFAGVRISELRGLRREDLDLSKGRVVVRQRADKWQQIGAVKSKNSRRTVPLPSHTVQAMKRWLLASPHSTLNLVFPNGAGNVESYANIYNRLWCPLMKAARLARTTMRANGIERIEPQFGIHALRHAAVSLWIEQGATPKKVMTWAGHASIQFTMDTYGHLWDDPAGDATITSGMERSILS